jgi:hypothetical protein
LLAGGFEGTSFLAGVKRELRSSSVREELGEGDLGSSKMME